MNEINYIDRIQEFIPFNEQEKEDKELILRLMRNNSNIYNRNNLEYHMTASSWIINEDMTKVLMVYHKIYDSWSWTGGHCDGNCDFLEVSIKEAKEETGVNHIRPVVLNDNFANSIFSLEALTVDGHIKNGKYVSSHLHLNLTFLLVASEDDMLHIKEDENIGVRWFTIEESMTKPTEVWFIKNIYSKLNKKLELLK